MKLLKLISEVAVSEIVGEQDIEIHDIEFDSRKASDGSLFVAIKGSAFDGHDYIAGALEQGCKAFVCEKIPDNLPDSVQATFVLVQDTAEALGIIASTWYDNPSRHLNLIGVTGTNGKTTIATTLYHLFRSLGYRAGLLSTVCNYVEEEEFAATQTTPDPITINALLAQMVSKGCDFAFMEVSSHAIVQKRIGGLSFKGGVFTNLTRDHLDYHKTFDAYLAAKKMFFDRLPSTAFALTNMDDKNGNVMLQNTKAETYTYSLQSMADFKGKIIEKYIDGMEMLINDKELHVQFIGRFNASNLLAVYGVAVLLKQDAEEVLVKLSTMRPVTGRFETIHSADGITAIVDYAHTPDALINVLDTIHDVLEGNGNVITVVGAGGNRDKGKRPLMAKAAVSRSHQLILTSDNPRFEDPGDILSDMEEGLDMEEKKQTLTIEDRRQAIRTACMLAHKGDVILIAGKGHENYQEVKGVKQHFDDREEVRKFFNM